MAKSLLKSSQGGRMDLTQNPCGHHGSSENKRKKFRKVDSQDLETDSEIDYDRFMTLRSKNTFPLTKADVFDVHDELVNKCGEPAQIWPRNDGCLVIEAKSKDQQRKILALDTLAGIELESSLHPTFNTCKGVMRSGELIDYDLKRLTDKMKDQKVIDAYRILRNVNGTKMPSSTIVLTFNKIQPPEYVKVGYLSIPIVPYIEHPRRCFQCQQFGHMSKYCKRHSVCVNCGNEYHGPSCNEPPCCTNCNGNHPASSKACTRFIYEKEVLAIRNKNRISFKEAHQRARKQYLHPGVSFADALKNIRINKMSHRRSEPESSPPQHNIDSQNSSTTKDQQNEEHNAPYEPIKRRLTSPTAPEPKLQRPPKTYNREKLQFPSNEDNSNPSRSLVEENTKRKYVIPLLDLHSKPKNTLSSPENHQNHHTSEREMTSSIPPLCEFISTESLLNITTDSNEEINVTKTISKEISDYVSEMRSSIASKAPENEHDFDKIELLEQYDLTEDDTTRQGAKTQSETENTIETIPSGTSYGFQTNDANSSSSTMLSNEKDTLPNTKEKPLITEQTKPQESTALPLHNNSVSKMEDETKTKFKFKKTISYDKLIKEKSTDSEKAKERPKVTRRFNIQNVITKKTNK